MKSTTLKVVCDKCKVVFVGEFAPDIEPCEACGLATEYDPLSCDNYCEHCGAYEPSCVILCENCCGDE